MDNELVERVARAIAAQFGKSTLWYAYESTAQKVLAELAGELANSERYKYWLENPQISVEKWDSVWLTPAEIQKAIDEARHG